MPSSVMLGSRPRICLTRAYSSAVRPCSAAISGVTLISTLAVAIFSNVLLTSPSAIFSISVDSVIGIGENRQRKWNTREVIQQPANSHRNLFISFVVGVSHFRHVPQYGADVRLPAAT